MNFSWRETAIVSLYFGGGKLISRPRFDFETAASYNLWPSQLKKQEREVSALAAIHMLLPLVGKNDV